MNVEVLPLLIIYFFIMVLAIYLFYFVQNEKKSSNGDLTFLTVVDPLIKSATCMLDKATIESLRRPMLAALQKASRSGLVSSSSEIIGLIEKQAGELDPHLCSAIQKATIWGEDIGLFSAEAQV